MDQYLFTDQLIVNNSNKIQIGTEIALFLLEVKNQIKIFHWQSKSYSEHKTLDKLFDLLTEHNDRWVETFMGKYGRIRFTTSHETLNLVNLNRCKTCVKGYLTNIVENLQKYRNNYFAETTDSDLSNIFDEIMADLNRAKYLLSLK